jgi:mRNA deadenylase 3'-5' endonuclease subunit Ccr4
MRHMPSIWQLNCLEIGPVQIWNLNSVQNRYRIDRDYARSKMKSFWGPKLLASCCYPRAVSKLVNRGQLLTDRNHVSILSYNILCDSLCQPSTFPQIDVKLLSSSTRWRNLQKEVAGFRCDVVCFQECSLVEWEVMNEFMHSQGYLGLRQKRDSPVPLAVFFQRWLDCVWVEERSRALICEFRAARERDSIFIINCHLEGNPEEGRPRVSQLEHALDRLLLRIQSQSIADPRVIVVGDFNSTYEEAPCQFMDKGILPVSFDASTHTHFDSSGQPLKNLTHPFEFREAYVECNEVPQWTHNRNGSGSRVDFVWVSRNLDICACLNPLPAQYSSYQTLLSRGSPNEILPSDHLPVGVTFKV